MSGLRPFGDEGTEPLPAPPPNNAPIMAAALGTLRDASKSRVFWILFATFFICGASTNGLIQVHLIPMCLDFGIPQVQAASLLAAMGIFDFFGTIVSGWLSDRYDNRYLLFWYYGLRGLSLLFLPFTDFSFYGLSLFAMFYGLDWIATVPPTVRLTAQRFGPERANLVFGWIFAGHQLGAAQRRLRCRPVADDLCDLSAGVLRRRRALRRRVGDRAGDLAAGAEGWRWRSGAGVRSLSRHCEPRSANAPPDDRLREASIALKQAWIVRRSLLAMTGSTA